MKKRAEEFNLLIVDDEEGIRESLTCHFEIDGFNIFTASGGIEALEVVKLHPIDFVISDVRMPEGDGIMLLKEIRKRNLEVPVVVMVTGFAELTPEEAKELGALDLLSKPFDVGKLESYIQQFVLQE